uniref:Uncharacterized protein n=1 Tax=Attheya septentrionalis TaxID=420275 RepID=A0A7S2XIN1_9STRA|mmetsp:Transcript_12360/g.22436  ORF Transcript_12360/g.22436 Transcript_12360/m.22436 type:complete len:616 (+) Transcript_12360:173-2020(+)|eukprot:CAMPEP_0198300998 /NCGR_PEP_ID=MMETSP1449-20131203/50246_1 /TAXON_ID=420275 /ORGANISM="Attheya septentrionalis, Strain CCMP2084" /LENGTH=615 /DNA_ID=CAMNT_0044002971 /DNA_START=142 /DNA_END=1989 /DNA_ORIENTATION=-
MDLPGQLVASLASLSPTSLLSSSEPVGESSSGDNPSNLSVITTWNKDVEDFFNSCSSPNELYSVGAGKSETDYQNTGAALQDASSTLHWQLISIIQIASAKETSEAENNAEVDKHVSEIVWESDEDAESAAVNVSQLVADTGASPVPLEDDASRTSQGDSLFVRAYYLSTASELLRACKNIVRFHNLFKLLKSMSRQPAETLQLSNPTRRLQTRGMIQLYLALMESSSPSKHPEKMKHLEMNGTFDGFNDVARNASITLFHATYGPPEDVWSTKARQELIDSVNGIPILMDLLLSKVSSTALLLSIVRNVHNLIGSVPGVVNKMDTAIEELIEKRAPDDFVKGGTDITSVLVETLTWTIKSEPSFPGDASSDRRADLALEILRVLYALRNGQIAGSQRGSFSEIQEKRIEDNMKKMGALLCAILNLPNENKQVYDVKLAAINLLMDAPIEYAQILLTNGNIPSLLMILDLQVTKVVVEEGGAKTSNATSIIPILAVMNRFSAANPCIQNIVKEDVFPTNHDDGTVDEVKTEEMDNEAPGGRNMRPMDAPKGTLRYNIIQLMTATESNSKRLASELLWTLCDADPNEFVRRTGFGNAVHMLGMKGLVKLPESVSIS